MSDSSVNESTKFSDESDAKDGTFENSTKNLEKNIDEADLLAKRIREYIQMFQYGVECVKNNEMYIFITKYIRPGAVILMCSFIILLFAVWPTVNRNAPSTESSDLDTNRRHPLAVFVFMSAFATHFGVQIWMTFIGGVSLYLNLSRHMFGQVQQVLFPKYFEFNAILCIIMIIIFGKYIIVRWGYCEFVQLFTLILEALIEAVVRLYYAPPLYTLMIEKYRLEEICGSGQEVGGLEQRQLVIDQHYQNVNNKFRQNHIIINICNFAMLFCACLQLYYISSKINF